VKHFILFYYILTFAFGLGSLFTFSLITFKTRNKMLFDILVFYIAFTLSVFFQMYSNYVEDNISLFFESTSFYHYIAENIVMAFLVFSIPFFSSSIANIKWRKFQNFFSAAILLLILIYNLIINKEEGNYVFLEILLFISIAYAIAIGIIFYRKINDKEQKKLLRNVCIAAAVFFPGIIYNEFPIFGYNFRVNPLLYCSFCIIFILFIVRIYFRDYYLTDQEIDALKDNNKTYKKSNVFEKYKLSDRERDVIICVLKGYSNKRIADSLFISLSTVKTHIHNSFRKTGADTRYELIHLIKFS
jgi:DNA-binding CsgD family transcriptional regulator